MELEMEDLIAVKKRMLLRISKQQDKLKGGSQELKNKEQMIRNLNRIIKNFRIDIHRVNEHYQNPTELRDSVKVSYLLIKVFFIQPKRYRQT